MKKEKEKEEMKKQLKQSIAKIIESDRIWKKEFKSNLSSFKKKKDKKWRF